MCTEQANEPPANPAAADEIAGAELAPVRDAYPRSRLCGRNELTLWQCLPDDAEHALCASPSGNNMHYRSKSVSGDSVRYPVPGEDPRGRFVFRLQPDGDAQVEFPFDGRRYVLLDRLRGDSQLLVGGPDGVDAVFDCRVANQSLQLNYTIRLMRSSGMAGSAD